MAKILINIETLYIFDVFIKNKNKSENIFISKPPDLGLNLNEPTEQPYTCR